MKFIYSQFNPPTILKWCANLMATAVVLLMGISSQSALAQQVVVTATAGTVGPTNYTTVKLAFDAINLGTHQGDVTVSITANTTEGTTPATLNSSGAGSALYTSVLVRPTADGVSVSGNPVTGFGVIQLKGADNVTINGDNPNTGGTNRNLTINNTTTTTVIANSCIRIATAATNVTSADNITIRNCNLNGNVTSGNSSLITSTTGSSNSSFGIYCGGNGGATAIDAPTAITSVTTQTAPSGTTINNLTIDNNAINQCARGIVFNGAAATVAAGTTTISNNVIGASGTQSGNPPFTTPASTVYTKGIWLNGLTTAIITGNTIQNLMSYVGTPITGIEFVGAIGAGNHTITGNTLTNVVNNASSAVIAMLLGSGSGTFNVSSNTLTGIWAVGSSVMGISYANSATSSTIALNNITTVRSRTTGGQFARGISVSSGNAVTIQNNFISDVLNIGSASFSNSFNADGILLSGGINHKVYHNSVNLFGVSTSIGSNSINCLAITASTQTGIDIRNNIFSNTVTGGAATDAHTCVFLPFAASATMLLTLNNNAYYTGSVAASGVAYINSTTFSAANLLTAANFNPALTTPSTNFRSFSSALGVGANDNVSFASTSAAPFLTSTNLHLDLTSAQIPNVEQKGEIGLVGVGTDIDGNIRPNTGTILPDMGADEVATAACTAAAGGTISPATQTKCAGQTATMSSVGADVGTGIGYQWEVSTVGGGAGFADVTGGSGATNTAYTTGALTAGTFYYRLRVTCTPASLTGYSNELVVTVNPNPTASVSPTSAAVCGGTPVALTASGGTTYAWSPTTGLDFSNVAAVNANPSSTTTYTVTVTDLGCTSTASVAISVTPGVSATASATPPAVCAGGNTQLDVAAVQSFTTPAAASYVFTTASGTALQTMTGATSIVASASDIVSSAVTNIGFAFNFGGVSYTQFSASSNGAMGLGGAAVTSADANNSTSFPTILPAWDDMHTCTDGNVQFLLNTAGGVGNRILIVEWNYGNYAERAGTFTKRVQVWLYEGTNQIKIVYGANTGSALSNATVGIVSASGNFNDVNTSTNANNTATAQDANTVWPATGTTYIFTPTGAPSFTYAWSESPAGSTLAATNIANPMANGISGTTIYTVTVTGNGGCTATSSVTVSAGVALTATSTATPATICAGASSTIAAVAAGGGAPYTYLWDNGAGTGATATVSPSSTTTYNVTVTDACLATATGSITVTVNPLPTATAGSNSPVCVGADLNLTATTDIGTSFAWAGPNTFTASTQNPSITGATLAATGTYTVTVTGGGCSATATTAVVISPLPPAVTVSATPATICAGSSSTLSAAATVSAYCTPTIVGTPGASGDFLKNFTFANITNNNTTDAISDYTYYNALTANVVANGVTTYNISLEAGGVSSLYAQQFRIWIDFNQNGTFETTESVFNTTASTFSPSTATGTITIPTTALNGTTRMRVMSKYSSTPATTEACTSTAGSYGEYEDYNVAITGGVSFTYAWNDPSNATTSSLSVSPSTTTTYTVTVTNNTGCTTTASGTITVNSTTAGITNNTASTELTCNTTSISVTATGGTIYAWSGGATPATAANSFNAAGTYTVTVTDNGCSSTAAITITSNTTPPTASATSTNTCAGSSNGTATVTASGGSSPYTYTWAAAPAFMVDHMPKTAAHPYFGVGSGTGYTIDGVEGKELTLVRGVTYTFDLTIVAGSHPWYITDDAVGAGAGTQYTTPSFGTTIPFTPTGAMPNLLYYQCANHPNMGWKINLVDAAAPNELTNLSAGTYTATVTGANGCTATADAVVGTTTVATPTLTITDNTCTPLAAGSISATGDLSNTLYYYTGVDATAASANAASNTGGSTTAPAYTTSVVYVCVLDEDANGCRSAAACGQTAPTTCSSCGAVAAAPTDGTNAAITFCQQGGTLTGSALADPTTLGASYARVYLLVDNATSIIWDNQPTVAALTAPANATSSDITYSIYSLVYSTDGFNDVVITNGVSNIIVGDPDVLTDADDNSPLEATPSANACMDLSPASAATVTVGQALIFDSSSDIICGNTSANIDLSSSIAGLQVTWTAAANPGSSITGFSNQVTPVTINALGTPDITQVLSNPSATTNFVNYIVTAQLGSCFGDPVTIPQSVMPNLNIGITGTTCSITGYNVTFAIIGGTGGYSVTGDDGIVNHSPGDATGGVAGVPSGNTLTLTVEDNDLCTATVSTTVTVPAQPTGLSCWQTATLNPATCVWDVTGTQDPMPTGLDCWETATFNTTTCVWDVTGTQDPMPTGLDCWETATFNTTTCVWDVTGTQDPMPTGLDCWETATFNTTTCVWDVTGTQDPMPTGLDCWETATFNTTTCVWDVTGTQDPMPTGLDCWETATFNTTTCVWDVTGTQDPMPTGLDCWETATFNTTTCVWDVTGTQDPMPTGLDCWETATFNTTTCVWDVTGTQDPMPTGLDCWETATFNTTTCVWDVTGTQDPMPTGLDCWETATFNTTTCVWDVTGTQDPMPTGLDCWETATFNTTTCVWDVTGTQDPMPTGLDCWETATFNTTTCVWDVTGTQDPMPTGLDCWETATFNTTTCVWDVTGTQDPMPTGLDCWETATFNTTTCVWDVTGTQDPMPTGLDCWETATFNTTTCVWDVTGTQDPMPTGLDCWETATFNTTTCVWDVTGTQDPMPTGLDCWETATFNTTTCVWDVTGTQDPMPTGLDCWETATFNTTTCVWDVTGTQDPMPTGLDCWETATFNTTTCVWDVTGTQDPMPTGLDCWETATFNTTTCVWDVTGTQDPMPTGLDCWETATFNTTTCVWDVTGTQDPMPTGLDCWETATFNTTTCVWDVTGTQDPMPTGLDCWETATFNTTTCVWDVTGTQPAQPTGLICWQTATFNTTTCVWDVTGSAVSPTASNNGPVCEGSTITLSVNPNLPVGVTATYFWSGPAGTATAQNPSIKTMTPAKTGLYTVTVTYSNGCTATATTVLAINPKPVVSSVVATCVAGSGRITVTATGTSLTYNIGAGAQTSNVFNGVANGTYTVVITNASGCTATANVTVNCSACPTPVASSNSPVCTGGNIMLSVNPNLPVGVTATYFWSGPGGNATLQNPTITNATTTKAGVYTVTVTYSNGCTATASATVTLAASISGTILGPSSFCSGGSAVLTATGGGTYAWSTSATTAAITVTTAGTYVVTITNGAACKRVSKTVTTTTCKETDVFAQMQQNLSVTPNPFAERATIEFMTNSTGHTSINVYSMEGKVVAVLYNANTQAGEIYQVTLDGANLPSGMYFVEMTNANGKKMLVKAMISY